MENGLVERKLTEIVRTRSSATNLEDVLGADVIQSQGTSKDGGLSKSQVALVSSTVALMQDRIIDLLTGHAEELRQQAILEKQFLVALAERTSTIREEFGKLYKTKLIQSNGTEDEPKKEGEEAKDNGVWRFVNWGNFLAITTVVLAGVAIFYTQAYASYKDRAEILDTNLGESRDTIASLEENEIQLQATIESLRVEAEAAKDAEITVNARYLGLEKQYDSLQSQLAALSQTTGAEKVLQDQVNQLNDQVGDLTKKLERSNSTITDLTSKHTEASSEARQYRDLYNQYKKRNSTLEESLAKLQSNNSKLLVDLEKAKRRRR